MISRETIRSYSISGRRGWSRGGDRRRCGEPFRTDQIGLITKLTKTPRATPLFECFVATATAEALQIDSDVDVAEFFKVADEIGVERFFQEPSKVLCIDFDSRQIGMMSDANIGKAKIAQKIFRLFDLGKGSNGDGSAIGNARGEAGESGFLPIGKLEAVGQLANVGLAQPRF